MSEPEPTPEPNPDSFADFMSRRNREAQWLKANAHRLCRSCWGRKKIEVFMPKNGYCLIVECPDCNRTGWRKP